MQLARGAVTLGYDVVGDGPALLLLHAFPLDRRMWLDSAERLSQRYRVIRLDFRGFGESTSVGPASLEDLAGDAAALLDALGVPMAAVCGLSMGGYVALAFAKLHAVRLSALILADTRAEADSADARRGRDEGIALTRTRGVAAFVAPMPGRLLSPTASPKLRAQVQALMEAQSTEGVVHALEAMRARPDRTSELAAIKVPTLLVRGSDDVVTGDEEMRAMTAAIRGARLCTLASAGHLANLDAPDDFAEAIGQFLDGVFLD
jgi:pimeloyl-ACP methyl ester carboxylesterase